MNYEEFVRERDEAFTAFVMTDDFAPVARYMRKYNIGVGENKKRPSDVLKASIYKAVRHCTNIPDEVKREAEVKCALLGFDPRMSFERDE